MKKGRDGSGRLGREGEGEEGREGGGWREGGREGGRGCDTLYVQLELSPWHPHRWPPDSAAGETVTS